MYIHVHIYILFQKFSLNGYIMLLKAARKDTN